MPLLKFLEFPQGHILLKKFHYNFPDPAKATGSEAEINNAFTEVRNLIKGYCKKFVEDNL